MINFYCGNCGESMEAPDSLLGESLKCPRCGIHTKVVQKITPKAPIIDNVVASDKTLSHFLSFILIMLLTVIPIWNFIDYSATKTRDAQREIGLRSVGAYNEYTELQEKILREIGSIFTLLYFILIFLVALILIIEKFRQTYLKVNSRKVYPDGKL